MNSSYSTDGVVINSIQSRILIYEKDGSSLKPIKIYFDKNGKKWIESRNNVKYVVEVKNNSTDRFLAVVSIDGLNVISGKRAKLSPEGGYILDPFSSMKINGWRTSLNDVREFMFTSDKGEAYSHKLGADETNMGGIGLAFFKQKPTYPNWLTYPMQPWSGKVYTNTDYTSGTTLNTSDMMYNGGNTAYSVNNVTLTSCASNGVARGAETKSLSMGTAQGEKVADKVVEAEYDFNDSATITDVIYYDSRENLIANGIIVEEKKMPEPFAIDKFCPSL